MNQGAAVPYQSHDYGGSAAPFSNFSQAFHDVDGRRSEEYDYERSGSLLSWDPRQAQPQQPPQQPLAPPSVSVAPPPQPAPQQQLRQLSGSMSALSLTSGLPYRAPGSRSGPSPMMHNPGASFGGQSSFEYRSQSPAVIYEQPQQPAIPQIEAPSEGGSYVAALRKQKATCWTYSRQPSDPHKDAAQKAAKQKAMAQVINSGSRGSVLVSDTGDFSLVPENANMIGVAAPTRMLAAFLDGGKLAEDEKDDDKRRSSTFLSRNAPKFALPSRMR